MPIFSIVVPTLNEELYLPKLLEDLKRQTFNPKWFEVIVIDGSSQDKTVLLAEKYKLSLNLKIYVVKKRHVSFQRNFGAKKAKTDWLIFMDADNRLPAYFLDGVKYRLSQNQKTDIFTTHMKIVENKTLDKTLETIFNFILEIYSKTEKVVAFGALIGAKKKVFQTLTFDEKQKVFEDSLFVNQAIKAGFDFKVFNDPAYIYSLRRVKKEGALKMLKTESLLQFKHLFGDSDFSKENYGYKMLGGSYYHSSKTKNYQNATLATKIDYKQQLEKVREKILELLG